MRELGPALPLFPFISLYVSFWALTTNPHSGHFLPTLQSPVGLPVPGVLESYLLCAASPPEEALLCDRSGLSLLAQLSHQSL